MPKKPRNSSSVTISIDSMLFEEFEEYVEKNFIDRSRLIESLIIKHIRSKKKK